MILAERRDVFLLSNFSRQTAFSYSLDPKDLHSSLIVERRPIDIKVLYDLNGRRLFFAPTRLLFISYEIL